MLVGVYRPVVSTMCDVHFSLYIDLRQNSFLSKFRVLRYHVFEL